MIEGDRNEGGRVEGGRIERGIMRKCEGGLKEGEFRE